MLITHPGRAEPALRAVAVHEPLLDLVEPGSDGADAFDGRDGHAVQRADGEQAAVHRTGRWCR